MMTFTSEQLATLRKIAQQATQGEWRAFISPDTGTYAVHTPGDERCGDIIKWPGFDDQKNAENNAEFIAAFNPKLVQTLLDERERNQQYIKSRDQENEEIALTVGRLRVELEGKDSKIANLTAERDALREGEMGDARHSNTRAAADIYFQLVEECEIPAGGSLVEYVDDMRENLEAAEKRIAELEDREILLPERSSMLHRTDFHEDYQTVMAYKVSEVIAAIRAAGIRIKGDAGEQNDEKP
ncbi:ead/Ea22-like family protein [Escherichia coli]|nr:ead/Ea22-like family protein [Escherichia coli]EGJ2242834.1 ead/Ea22-like family protein [Escherichia coli]EIH8515305.1 ead/Ea22-like family protein [Escherichia coli]